MPAATSISINDATPTAHVFDPLSVTPGGEVQYFNQTDAPTHGTAESICVSYSRANANRDTYRSKVRINLPYVKTVDGAVELRDTSRFTIEAVLPSSITADEADDAMAMLVDLLSKSVVQGHLKGTAPIFA